MKKLYCYVDETGIDTEGKFFLVAAILVDQQRQEIIEQQLKRLEQTTRKGTHKWTRAAFDRKEQYLLGLSSLRELKACIFYAVYHDTKEYTTLTALTVAKAVLAHVTRIEEEYSVSIVIDALTRKDAQKVREQLKLLKIHYREIRGMKDEQNIFLRLADSMAGFMRDCQEEKAYTGPYLKRLQQAALVIEV
jgi:hypothetical protein